MSDSILRSMILVPVLATAAVAHPFDSSTIVQSGSLTGGGAPGTQPVKIDAFDDQNGALTLKSVRVEVLTSVIGGCTTNGTGIPTQVYARLVGNFSLGASPLVDTEAVIDTQVSNVGPPNSLTFFDTDSGSILLSGVGDLSPWIGTGELTMDAFTEFEISETPPDSVFFSAGGSIAWSVTYTFDATTNTTFVEEFETGTNEGSWSWGTGNETVSPLNGNPGAFLQDLTLFSCCPTASTSFGSSSSFTGNYRQDGVISVGVDLITLDASLSVSGRPLSVILVNDNGTPSFLDDDFGAFFVGAKDIPDAGVPVDTPPGWADFDFVIPSAATSLPTGWQTFDATGFGASDSIWNAVVVDVDALQFFYGDPTQVFLFLSWDVGMDNVRITRTSTPGPGTPYAFGVDCPCGNDDPIAGCLNSSGSGSVLTAAGTSSVAADDLTLTASDMPQSVNGILFMGSSAITAVPFGDGLRGVGGLTFRYPFQNSGPGGSVTYGPGLSAFSVSNFPVVGHLLSGTTWNFQQWYRDPPGPCGSGFNLSNGMSVTFTP